MSKEIQSPYEMRQKLEHELWEKIKNHPEPGPWQEGYPGGTLALNGAGHHDGVQALRMIVEDLVRAVDRDTPIDIIQLEIQFVVEWRKLLLEGPPRGDGDINTGEITRSMLETELSQRLDETIVKRIFSS